MPSTSYKSDTDKLTRLVGSIYDAALNSALWNGVLQDIADFVGGQAAGLVFKDAANEILAPDCIFGLDHDYLEAYQEFGKFDPLMVTPNFKMEQVLSVSDLTPFADYRRTPFYHEWTQPQGWVDVANAVVGRTVTRCQILTVLRSEAAGMVDDDTRKRMSLVVPCVRRALLVRNAINLKQSKIATFAATFDGLSASAFFVDAAGRIVHTNAAGDDILRKDDYLRSVGGRLVARNTQVNEALQQAFAAAETDTGIASKGIALPLTAHDGDRHIAHVLPLTARARESAGIASTAAAAVFVRKAAMERPSPEVIAKVYELTPAELRVLFAVAEAGGISEIAEALEIAETTVKTHLRRLFEKTGVSRQADLIKLVAGFASPLIG